MPDSVDRSIEEERGLRARMRTVADAGAHEAQALGTTTAPVGTPTNPSDRVLTVANLITLCRLMLTVAFLILFVSHQNRSVAIGCYIVAAVTDFIDGQVARRTHTVSWLGKVMDPIMDRILLFTGVLGLVITGELPVWVAVFVCGRDAILGAGMLALQRYRRRPVDVIIIGKLATALLMFGFSDLLLGVPMVEALRLTDAPWLPGLNAMAAPVGIFFVYAGIVCSSVAMVRYVHDGLLIRRQVISEREMHGSN